MKVTTGQLKELVSLRHCSAPVETALRGFLRELGRREVSQESDLADIFEMILIYDQYRAPLGRRVQEIIVRLRSDGIGIKTNDRRVLQAKHLWDRGFGRELGFTDFAAYLAGIPRIPKPLRARRRAFPLLCLADPRLGLSKSCSLLGIGFNSFVCTDADVMPYNDRHLTPMEPFWFRFTAPGTNMGRRPSACRDEFFAKGNFAGTAMTGIMAYTYHPTLIEEGTRTLDLPGSRHRRNTRSAYLEVWHGGPMLSLDRPNIADPGCGAGGFSLG